MMNRNTAFGKTTNSYPVENSSRAQVLELQKQHEQAWEALKKSQTKDAFIRLYEITVMLDREYAAPGIPDKFRD